MSFTDLIAAVDRAAREDDDGRTPCVRCTRRTGDPLGVCGKCRGMELAERKAGLRGLANAPLRTTRREADGR